jgi:hypothetical protein
MGFYDINESIKIGEGREKVFRKIKIPLIYIQFIFPKSQLLILKKIRAILMENRKFFFKKIVLRLCN